VHPTEPIEVAVPDEIVNDPRWDLLEELAARAGVEWDGPIRFSRNTLAGVSLTMASIAVLPSFESTAVLKAIESLGPTVMCIVPSALQMILDTPLTAKTNLSSMRQIIYAGSPISAETLRSA